MALTCLLSKRGDSLIAEDAIAIEGFQKIPDGQRVRAIITVPRNLKHHNKLFVLLDVVLQAQSEPHFFLTTADLLEELKMGMGYFRMVTRPDGSFYPRTHSIDFATLDQIAFSAWYDRAVTFILENILKHNTREDIEQRVYDILGEPGPAQFERRK